MANRVLLGEHGTYGYGLFISKPSIDVTGANKNYFLFDTTGASMGQILVFERHEILYNQSITETFNNFGKNTFGIIYNIPATGSTVLEDRYGMTILEDQSKLSLSIEKNSSTESQYTVTNSKSGDSSYKLGAAVIIFAEEM